MNKAIEINLAESLSLLNGGTCSFTWVKRVVGIDMSGSNGFALEGDFINDAEVKANQLPGIYVTHNKGRGWFRTNVLRLNEDGTLEKLACSREGKFFNEIKHVVKEALA